MSVFRARPAECLDWIFCSGLIEAGRTIVRYDDWLDGQRKHGQLMGEQRAHREITQRHRVVWEHTALSGSWFRVLSYRLSDSCAQAGYATVIMQPKSDSPGARRRSLLPQPPGAARSLAQCYRRVQLWNRSSKAGTLFACERQRELDRWQAWALAPDWKSAQGTWSRFRTLGQGTSADDAVVRRA
eukprot:6067842-Prymnesium_polylepis.1